MSVLNGKSITIAVTGGIAAFKICHLIRILRRQGASVRVAMTWAAQKFITPLSFEALSGSPVSIDAFAGSMTHIALTHDHCDLLLVAPATANILAKAAAGIANDLVSTAICASSAPVAFAPAMNTCMWTNPATQRNIKILQEDGRFVLPCASGELACGETGDGRMLEPENITAWVRRILSAPLLTGRSIVITAGPTFEPIDPVRGITNRSSGRQGYAIAQAAWEAGADVTLVSGPVSLATPTGVRVMRVETARQMLQAVQGAMTHADIFVSTAAVSDWGIDNPAGQKLKKSQGAPQVLFTENPDILALVPQAFPHAFCVGFAAETQNIVANALQKLHSKKVQLIVANDANTALGSEENTVSLVDNEGVTSLPRMDKHAVAELVIRKIAQRIVPVR